MNKDDNLNSKKSVNVNHNKKLNPQNQRDKLKIKIMNKYGVSFEESERILSKLESSNKIKTKSKDFKQKEFIQEKTNFDKPSISDYNLENNGVDSYISRNGEENIVHKKSKEVETRNALKISNKKQNSGSQSFKDLMINDGSNGNKTVAQNKTKGKHKDNLIKDLNNQEKNISPVNEYNFNNQKYLEVDDDVNSNSDLFQDIKPQKKSVDSIIEDIVPNYNQQISISLNHVNLTFEVDLEKIDTIKEEFLRFIKREKKDKIKIPALRDVSFNIYKGEKVGIIGYNGAGKSTLLTVIAGIFPPDKGTVTTYGSISPLLSLGAGFDYNFSGRRNIILNGAVLGYEKEFLESKMDEIIEFSELGDFIDIPIKNYSSGMLAKLGFSIATAVNPDILIIDEILGVGDVNFQKKSSDKIKSLMDAGTTVVLVSHSIPQIRALCDKAIWIDNGFVIDMGEVNKVCDEYLKNAEKASNEQLANIKLVND